MASTDPQLNLDRLTKLRTRCELLTADEVTAHVYGEVRAASGNVRPIGMSKLNDLWIAALCLQHDLPLLTNDHGFDSIAGLTVIHW